MISFESKRTRECVRKSINDWTPHERNQTPLNAIHAMLVWKLNQILPFYFITLLNLNLITIFAQCIFVSLVCVGVFVLVKTLRALWRPLTTERCWPTWGVNCINPQMALMLIVSIHLAFFSTLDPPHTHHTQPSSHLSPFKVRRIFYVWGGKPFSHAAAVGAFRLQHRYTTTCVLDWAESFSCPGHNLLSLLQLSVSTSLWN